MKISVELIRRCSSRHLMPAGGDGDPLERITHLYLQEQRIRTIESLECCRHLIALYLYENQIQRIENLDHLNRLSCLYLHRNNIARIENLDSLTHLTVLNLAHNCISRVEGLEALSDLRELYLQYQNLPEDQNMEFDTDTVSWLGESLRVLNVSGNRLQSLSCLKPLRHLVELWAEDNVVEDLSELLDSMELWRELLVLRLTGNPVCEHRKYRDKIVLTCLELEDLDGKIIPQSYKNFLLNWKQCQSLQNLKRESYQVLRPFLETQIKNKQLSPPRPTSEHKSSSSQSEASSSCSAQSRSRSACSKTRRSLQEVPLRLIKKISKNR